MTETDLSPAPFVDLVHDAARPVHLNVLTRHAVRCWLEARAEERQYAPGARYEPGERIQLQGQWATVADVQPASNPVQGYFSILTLTLPDGSECLMAADVDGAPVEEREPVTDDIVDEVLDTRGREARQAVREILDGDRRFVSCSTTQGELWCLREIVPKVTQEELQLANALLPGGLVDGELDSRTTEELAAVIWDLEDDGGEDYALYAFALRRALDDCGTVRNLGDRWASTEAWETLCTQRESLTSPRQAGEVEIPEGVKKASESEVAQESAREMVEEEAPEEETPEPLDLEAWRRDHPDHAIFTLRARHYYEGWLPLSKVVRQLFPPLGIEQQEVTFHHHFGDEPESFRAYVDRDAGRIWVSPEMYKTFHSHRVYPGARLRLSARNEQEFDLATRPTDKTEPIHVWRMWLNEDDEIEYEDFEEQRRYDIDDDVYVADVRFEDREALFRQAEETGASVFQLMYEQAVEWWEENGRKSLVVTADQLFNAIHPDEQGRMVSKATIGWELWKRLAFQPLGGGRYRFRPRFGAEVRAAVPRARVEPKEEPAPPKATAYFIFQQRSDSEYADQAGEIYNWRKGIPGSRQVVEGARFIYYRPGDQVFFGMGRVTSIDTYTAEDGETYYDGHIADYEPWDPPLPLTRELARRVSFVSPSRLGVGQAGIRKISRDDFVTIVSAYGRARRERQAPKLVTEGGDELWDRVVRLEGQTLHTLAQASPFKVATATEEMLILELEKGTRATIPRDKLEGAYAQLLGKGEILRSEIEAFFPWDSSYATAILATLPSVRFKTNPLRLFYEAPTRQPRESVAPATERTRSGQLMATGLVPLGPLFESPGEPTPKTKDVEDDAEQPIEVRSVSPDDFSMGIVDEVINIRALRAGEQIVLCKTHRKSNDRIFLLPKVSFTSHFKPSRFAEPYTSEPVRRDVTRQIAEIEYLSVPGESKAFWEELFELGEFNLWDIEEGPLVYFEGVEGKRALLWILRVYELPFGLREGEDFQRGRRGSARIINDESLRKIQTAFAQRQCEAVVEDDEFERRKQTIVSTARRFQVAEDAEVEGRLQEAKREESQFGAKAEFQQIRKIIEDSLIGETVHTLSQRKPNEIVDYSADGLTVVTESGEAQVRWEWIKDVYEALSHLREIESKDVQEGEFQTPGGYRGAFIFALLARFAHVEARTKPRRKLIYHDPEGTIRLQKGSEDEVAGVGGESP